MKKRLIAAAIAAMLCTATAHAQWVVIDPTNLVQNTLTAIRTLEQINNQIKQLQNEAQMLINQARNLASLPSSVVGQLRANLATTERLIAQARGLAYDVTNLDREFARLYPEQYAATVSGDQMYRDAQERWKNTLNGLQTTMQMQAQVENLGEDESVLADPRGQEPVCSRCVASHAGHEPVAGIAGQAVDPVATAPDHAGSCGLAGTGAAGGGPRARPRGAATFPGRWHAAHAAALISTTDAEAACGRRVLALSVVSCPPAREQPADHHVDALAAYPMRLKALRAQCAADRQATGQDACRAAAEPSAGASFPARPGQMNTRRWPTCRRSHRASMSQPMA